MGHSSFKERIQESVVLFHHGVSEIQNQDIGLGGWALIEPIFPIYKAHTLYGMHLPLCS